MYQNLTVIDSNIKYNTQNFSNKHSIKINRKLSFLLKSSESLCARPFSMYVCMYISETIAHNKNTDLLQILDVILL